MLTVSVRINSTNPAATRALISSGVASPNFVAISDATPDEIKALVAAGFVLFILTLTVNMVASAIVTRSTKGAAA